MSKAVEDSMLGRTVLGRYRIVRKLARGGMGAVYLARAEGAEGFVRPVVIKRVLPTLMDDPEVAQLFVREARILAELQHSNIVAVLDFGQQDDGAYVTVFEYVNGYTLAQWCRFVRRAHEQLPIDIALHIALRVLDPLEYAHGFRRADGKPLQIIHRDVSPSNVFLSEQGTVKLLDFGIAQVSGDSGELHTERPRIRGKLPYVPLEIFRGEPATVQSDVYAAGVLLYELLTGANPFDGRETADIFHKVANVTPPSVHAVRDDAPEDIDAVLERALDRDPRLRYRSAAAFAEALRALRREPEDLTARRLAERLRRDFVGPMPEALGLEPLHAREAAWRDQEANAPMAGEPATDSPPRSSIAPNEVVTVHASISPELLAGATRETERESAAPARSSHRLAWFAGASAFVSAVATALTWLAVSSSPTQPVVVVERPPSALSVVRPSEAPKQSSPSSPPSAAAAAEVVAAELAQADDPAATTEKAATAEPRSVQKRDPSPPNPRALTRAFGRRQRHVEACFDTHAAALEGQPQLSLHFRVGTGGNVLDAKLEPQALASTALGRCLLQVARATRFHAQQHELAFHIPITAKTKP